MKNKLPLLVLALIFVFSSFSQNNSLPIQKKADSNKPIRGFMGIGIDYKLQREVHIVNSYYTGLDGIGTDYRVESYNYFPALKFDYYLTNDLSLNLFYRPSFLNKDIKNDMTSTNKSSSQNSIELFSMDIGFGVEKHFFKKLKVDPFIGLNIHYIYSGKSISKSKIFSNYESGNLHYFNERKGTGVETQGFYTTANLGLNYFVSPNFSLGINLDLGYKYSIQEGKNKTYYHNIIYKDNSNKEIAQEYEQDLEIDLKNENKGFIYSFSIKSSFYFATFKKNKAK